MLNKYPAKLICLLLVGMSLLSACTPAIRAPLGERFTIQEGQNAKIIGEPFTIKLHVIGVEWVADDEVPFAELTLKVEGQKKDITLYMYDDWEIGAYTLEMTRADPFDRDPLIDLVVTRP